MRKYLWALALCGAAGMTVPAWAQERSKSLFGLGRSAKTTEKTPEKQAKPEKTGKLKNYAEIFGRDEGTAEVASGDAPSPAAVQQMVNDAEQTRSKSPTVGKSMESDFAPKRSLAGIKTGTPSKSPMAANATLADDLDELEALEEQDELREEQEEAVVSRKASGGRAVPVAHTSVDVAGKSAAKRSSFQDAEEETPSRTDAKPDLDQHAWAVNDEKPSAPARKDLPKLDFDSEAGESVAPPVKPSRVTANPSVRSVSPTSETPAKKSTAARSLSTRLNTPIAVDAESQQVETKVAEALPVEESSAAMTNEPVEKPVSEPAQKSRLSFSRSKPSTSSSGIITTNHSSPLTPSATSSRLTVEKSIPEKNVPKAPSASQSPAVSVEWRATGAVTVGQDSTCELVVKNTGSVAARQVEVEAAFPANVRLISSEPKPNSTSKLIWEFSEIGPGEEKVVHVKFKPVERGDVSAEASVRFTGAASTSFAVTEPLLALNLKGPSEVLIGENASHTLMISNPGNGMAANVKVEAIIPAGLEHSRGDRLSMELGNLAPGENRPVHLALTAIAGGRQVIEVHATADNLSLKSAAAEVSVIAPSLEAKIDGPGLRYLGRQATYTLHVANDGAAATDNVRVMHKVPEGFEFVSADPGVQFDSQNRMVNWFVGRLDRGEQQQAAVVLNAKSSGEFTHFVRATSEHGAISDTELATRVEGAASLVVDIKDIDDPVEVGVETAYEIQVKNEGTAPALNVGLTCELPSGMEFMDASGDSDHAHAAESVAFKPVSEVAPGKTLTYRVKVKGVLSGSMRFRTKVSSDSLSEPLASEEMTKIYGE